MINSCKSNDTKTYNQAFSIDTSARYFSYIKKYMAEYKSKNYIIQLSEIDTAFRIKIAATDSFTEYDNIPLSIYEYQGNNIYIYTGIEDLLLFDTAYLNSFNKMRSHLWHCSLQKTWCIITNDDTCFYVRGKCGFVEFKKPVLE